MKSKSKGKFRETFTKEKIIRFLDKQGFYIVLFVCIVIIGVTVLLTSGKDQKPGDIAEKAKVDEPPGVTELADLPELAKTDGSDGLNESLKDKIDIKVKDSEQNLETENGTQETLAANTAAKSEQPAKTETPKEKKDTEKKDTSPSMVYPVQGKIIKEYSMDELVYSSTLKEWTTHPGIDIESSVGEEVKAALGGTVEEIIQDPLMGICITLDHGNGLKTCYANLSTANMVTVDQKVDKGQIISGVGRTAGSEILDSPHLHFEVRLDGQSVDPKEYLK
ncbi:MAG: M23 family metallopeptidase [Clostridiales bacterium]|nr:M23 family metallopeptidase [Clostridiales bacterium]